MPKTLFQIEIGISNKNVTDGEVGANYKRDK